MDSKIIYKLMVDNNPDEAIKQLVYFDKRAIEQDLKYDILKSEKEGLERYTKRLQKENERLNNNINKAIEVLKLCNSKCAKEVIDILEGE